MLIAAAVLTLGIGIEVDLRALIDLARRKPRVTATTEAPKVTCNIKVVGYHISGRPGQRFEYAGETFTLPAEGFIEVISLPRVKHYSVDGRQLPLDDGRGALLDPFSFSWISLPASPIHHDGEATPEVPAVVEHSGQGAAAISAAR